MWKIGGLTGGHCYWFGRHSDIHAAVDDMPCNRIAMSNIAVLVVSCEIGAVVLVRDASTLCLG